VNDYAWSSRERVVRVVERADLQHALIADILEVGGEDPDLQHAGRADARTQQYFTFDVHVPRVDAIGGNIDNVTRSVEDRRCQFTGRSSAQALLLGHLVDKTTEHNDKTTTRQGQGQEQVFFFVILSVV
jgi:hypothetical protein